MTKEEMYGCIAMFPTDGTAAKIDWNAVTACAKQPFPSMEDALKVGDATDEFICIPDFKKLAVYKEQSYVWQTISQCQMLLSTRDAIWKELTDKPNPYPPIPNNFINTTSPKVE